VDSRAARGTEAPTVEAGSSWASAGTSAKSAWPAGHAAFERLVRRHAERVRAFLVYRCGDSDLADDLLADTFERAYAARFRFDRRRASELTWLCTIALNRWRDVARRRVTEAAALERLAEAQALHEDPQDGWVERRAVLAALDTLDADQHEAVALVYGADLTAVQAAKVLDVPATTVRGRVYRALPKLRDALAAE